MGGNATVWDNSPIFPNPSFPNVPAAHYPPLNTLHKNLVFGVSERKKGANQHSAGVTLKSGDLGPVVVFEPVPKNMMRAVLLLGVAFTCGPQSRELDERACAGSAADGTPLSYDHHANWSPLHSSGKHRGLYGLPWSAYFTFGIR